MSVTMSLASNAPHTRHHFFAGGEYVASATSGEKYLQGQMYVEHLVPSDAPATSKCPVVLIHGQGLSGATWLDKPDGGIGWASRFLEAGREVYIIDQPSRGRSSSPSSTSTFSADVIARRFTAPAHYHNLAFPTSLQDLTYAQATEKNSWPQAGKHTQWPGAGLPGDAIFDDFYASIVPFDGGFGKQQVAVRNAGAELLRTIGREVILLGHSQGGTMPLLITDAEPDLVRGLVLLEPTGPPFRDAVFKNDRKKAYGITDAPLEFLPPALSEDDIWTEERPARDDTSAPCIVQAAPARILKNLVGKRTVIVTGEASYHAPYDYCTAEFLKQGGCPVEHFELGEMGIKGNGHMLYMEKNSDEVFRVVNGWIEKLD